MLALEDVRKPALMRTIFRLGSVYSAQELTRRRSSPRRMVYDTALMSAVSDKGRNRLLGEGDLRGCMVESSVGASLLARALEEGVSLETPVNTRWVVRPSSAVAPSEL